MAVFPRQGQDVIVGWKLRAVTVLLWAVAITVVGATLGIVFGGPLGALAGPIAGTVAGAVAGFLPALRDDARQARAELAARETAAARAEAEFEAVGEPPLERLETGPSGLLRPDQKTVAFTGRKAEQAVLRSWWASGEARSARVLVGAGGVGKTRLALQVAEAWAQTGARWRLVAAGKEAQAASAARAVTSGPVLLVVDYAETRSDLGPMLTAVVRDPGPIRVLLIARSLGEWWERLIEESAPAIGRLLTAADPISLAGPVTAEASDEDLVMAALPYFADASGLPVPEQVEFELPARRAPVLVLHAAALVAVLRSAAQPLAPLRVVVAIGVLDELLEHEARYWRRTARAAGLPGDGTILKPAVAAAALLGADNLPQAAEVAQRTPALANETQAQLRLWGRWLYGLYPPGADGSLGSLQPDLLAETHVVRQLANDPDLARRCLSGLTEPQAERALTILTRADAHQDDAGALISQTLAADLTHLAMPAARVAVQTRGNLGPLLAQALQDAPVSHGALEKLAVELPYPSVALAQAHLAATWRVMTSLPPDAEPQTVAHWHDEAVKLLSQLGRPAEALAAEQEAVAIRRELAAADPDRYRPDLAQSLTGLGITFSELGRPAEALAAEQEAVAIRRELAAADPDRYRPYLAQSLSNLGASHSELGRPAEALAAEQEAVAIRRELAAADPDRYRPSLAQSLSNLGTWFSELGRPAEALPVTEQAVAIRQELAAANPDRYRPDLAGSLSNLGVRFWELGRPAEALAAEQEAVAIRRELAAANPDRYRPSLAQSLAGLGVTFGALSRPAEALPVTEEAVATYRELAAANPDRYRPELALALGNLGVRLSALGRLAEALTAKQESVAIRRELAAANPDRYRPDLALALSNLDVTFAELGRPAEALTAEQEAVAIRRELATASPDRYRPDLAQSLTNLGVRFLELGRPAEALPVTEQAVAICRELAAANPDRYRSDLALALTNLAEIMDALNRRSEAEQVRSSLSAWE